MFFDPVFRLVRNLGGLAVPMSLPAITVGEGQEYATLSDAFAVHGDSFPYYIVGEIADNPTIDAEIYVYGGPGARITGNVTFAGNTNFVEFHDVAIYGAVILSGVTIPASVFFYDCYIYNQLGIAITMDVSVNSATVGLYGETRVQGGILAGNHGISLTGAGGGTGIVMANPSAFINGSYIGASYGIYAEDDVGTPLLAAGTLLRGCMVRGTTDAIYSTVAVTVPAYGCLLENGVNVNVTLPAGGGNVLI